MADRIGIMTGGGDCPGLNAVIRGIVRKSVKDYHYEVLGFLGGWRGVLDRNFKILNRETVSGILHKGGTIIGTSRTNPLKVDKGIETIVDNVKNLDLQAIIAIGGEDTLGVAKVLSERGVNIIGVPKTIDNDLDGTDYTFGYDTAINIVMEAIDRLHTTAESHNRVMVVEVMGRHTGWIAIGSGLAGGADVILIPEKPFDIEEVCSYLTHRHSFIPDFSIVVVAEGAKFKISAKEEEKMILQTKKVDEFGHVHLGGIGSLVAKEIEQRTGFESRVVIPGHIQRGGTPTAFDRILGTRLGLKAIDMVRKKEFGKMAALRGTDIIAIPFSEAVDKLKLVTEDMYKTAEVFFG